MKQIKQSRLNPETGEVTEVDKSLEKKTEAPQIEDALSSIDSALKQAVKAKQKRRHICRVCEHPDCLHYERKYTDTDEEVDMHRDPETGEWYINKDGGE